MHPTVKLVSYTPNPIETIFATEKYAKTNTAESFLIDPKVISTIRNSVKCRIPEEMIKESTKVSEASIENVLGAGSYEDYVRLVEEWAVKVVSMAIPVSEMVQFVFQFDNVSIAWREQIVRHRTNAYWIQSGRITDYSKIYEYQMYNVPDSIKDNPTLSEKWHDHWKSTQQFYIEMKNSGVLDQDAREIVGNGALHRMTMGINLRNLIHLAKHRTCWIAQDHWVEIIRQMVEELRKVDPLLGIIGHPPCFKNGKFSACQYEGMSQERYDGKDPLPVCPMWYGNTIRDGGVGLATIEELVKLGRYDKDRVCKFNNLWFGEK